MAIVVSRPSSAWSAAPLGLWCSLSPCFSPTNHQYCGAVWAAVQFPSRPAGGHPPVLDPKPSPSGWRHPNPLSFPLFPLNHPSCLEFTDMHTGTYLTYLQQQEDLELSMCRRRTRECQTRDKSDENPVRFPAPLLLCLLSHMGTLHNHLGSQSGLFVLESILSFSSINFKVKSRHVYWQKSRLHIQTSQELRMLSPSLFIQGSQCKC